MTKEDEESIIMLIQLIRDSQSDRLSHWTDTEILSRAIKNYPVKSKSRINSLVKMLYSYSTD